MNKRSLALTISLGATIFAAGCGSPAPNGSANGTADNTNTAPPSRPAMTANNTPSGLPPVTAAHGGSGAQTAPLPPATAGGATKPGMDTAALDARIEKAEAKAKARSATPADKLAAAAVYLERANLYRDAGQPSLYKFALSDYRHVLRYQPDNREARGKMDEIVSIYQSMGRPVPDNGLEP